MDENIFVRLYRQLLAYARSWQQLQPQPVAAPALPWIAGWTLAGGAALAVGWLLAAPLGVLFLLLLPNRIDALASSGIFQMVGFVMGVGIASSVLQWLLLRRHLPQAGWWIPVSFAGWLLAVPLIYVPELLFGAWLRAPLAMLGLLGGSVGLVQWLLLRRLLPHAGWWLPLNVVAFTTILLAGDSFGSFSEMAVFLLLPHLITGTALWVLLQAAPASTASRLPELAAQKTSPRARALGRRVYSLLGLLALLVLAVAGPWIYATAQLEMAKRDGVYASAEEGLRTRAAQVEGAQLLRIDGLWSGPNARDGRLPHVWFATGSVFYDQPPPGWSHSATSVGSFYVRVRDGWVHMPEGAFPQFIGRVMEIYNLEGVGEEGQR